MHVIDSHQKVHLPCTSAIYMDWEKAPDIQRHINYLIEHEEFTHVQKDRVFCYRTRGSKSRAIARTWAFPKVFQNALQIKAAYVIEVIAEHFDRRKDDEKTRILIHELLHIPKNFSGSLLPHKFGKKTIDREVDRIYKSMKEERWL